MIGGTSESTRLFSPCEILVSPKTQMEHNIVNECYGVNKYKTSVYHHGSPMQSNYQVIAMYRNFNVDDELSPPDIDKLFFLESVNLSVITALSAPDKKPGDGTKLQITIAKGSVAHERGR